MQSYSKLSGIHQQFNPEQQSQLFYFGTGENEADVGVISRNEDNIVTGCLIIIHYLFFYMIWLAIYYKPLLKRPQYKWQLHWNTVIASEILKLLFLQSSLNCDMCAWNYEYNYCLFWMLLTKETVHNPWCLLSSGKLPQGWHIIIKHFNGNVIYLFKLSNC